MARTLTSLFIALTVTLPALAQTSTGSTVPPEGPVAVISGPDDIAVGRTLVLDASLSRNLPTDATYRWYRDSVPQPISRTVEAVYTPERPGITTIRLVIRGTVDGRTVEVETRRVVTVYRRKIVLMADATLTPEKLELHRQAAAEVGTYLRILQTPSGGLPMDTEQAMTDLLSSRMDALNGAEAILLWTEGITGIQALTRAVESSPGALAGLDKQTVVLVTSSSLQRLARTVRGHFAALKPARIIITRKEAVNPLVSAPDVEAFLKDLEQRDIDVAVVDAAVAAVRPWNLLTSVVNAMLMKGVSSQTVILLLMLPVIATILAFLKQVVGVTTFGLYTPSVVALSLLALGWRVGLLFLLLIITAGYATRMLMRRWRLLYIPKVAIIITTVSLTLLLMLAGAAFLGTTFSRDTVFILLIMSTLSESFLNVKAEEGWYSAMIGIGETVLAALLCVFIVQWSPLQSLVLAYPESILLTILFNAALGRWTGLRLVEYFRFREVFRHLQEE